MSVKITYFVHGTTIDNEKGLATGWLQGELSAKGIERVNNLKELIKDKHFDQIFCSDLKRAVDSANILFSGKCEVIHDKRLRECNYGDFDGKPVNEFKNDMNKFIVQQFLNGESYLDVEKRMRSFCDYLKNDFEGKSIAIVAHQAPQLALEVIIKGKTWEQAIAEDWRKTGDWQAGWEYNLL